MAGGIDWFRWHHGSVTDPKFQLVARKAGASLPDVLAVWAYLLEQASASEHRGHIGEIDAEALDCLFDFPTTETRTANILAAFQQRGLIAGSTVSAWEKRQPKRERDTDSSADRTRAYRERQQATKKASQNHVTPCDASEHQKNARGEESREEEEISAPSIPQAQPEPTAGGRICKAMRQQGLADGNPSNPTLLALIAAGATDDEFVAAAKKAVAEQKGFAYAIGIVTGERKRAAALALQIHHGELPAAATRPSFAQQAADIARTTVPAKPGPDPTLAAIEQDAQRAAPPSAEQREKIKQLLRQRPAVAAESDSK